MKAAILQPSFLPWRGYFHQIQKVDCFVFYDDVQYDKHGWRNRNRIKTAQGAQWLTVPVSNRGVVSDGIAINAVEIDWSTNWPRKHLATVKQAYARAPYLQTYLPIIEKAYAARPKRLVDLTVSMTRDLAAVLGLDKVQFYLSSELGVSGEQTERLLRICSKLGAGHYLSGPSARSYLKEEMFGEAGLTLQYMEYLYPEYPQLHGPFDPQLSIIDLLFMTGPEAPRYIWKTDAQCGVI